MSQIPKHHVVLTENDVAKIINGEGIHIEFKQPIKVGEKIIVRKSYMKDIAADTLIRKNRVMNTVSNTFEY